jgi:carboxylate-amine ligase
MKFPGNDWPTLGVELELQLVDSRSMALKNVFGEVFQELPEGVKGSVKPEFMQCYAEVTSGVCRTAASVEADLNEKFRATDSAAARCGARLCWAGTHPFSRWRNQRVSPDRRYYKLANLFQETVVRPVTFGLHVHVGVESGDKAVEVVGRLVPYLPLLLALSANSPLWQGRWTGHHAHRVELLEALPSGGPPPRLRCWDEYLSLVRRMTAAGFIESERDLWWDVRPNAAHGTVEVRVCDMPADLPDVLGLTALIQCLVSDVSSAADRGEPRPEPDPLMVRQNRWRACRFGAGADLVDYTTLEAVPARRAAMQLSHRLRGVADRLGCTESLAHVTAMAARPSGAERQISLYKQTGDLTEVVRAMVRASDAALRAPQVGGSGSVGSGVGVIGLAGAVPVA